MPYRFRLLAFALLPALAGAERLSLEKMGTIVRVADPQISPDARSIAVLVSRANFDENRYDAQLVLIDTATRAQRVLVGSERRGLASPRWSPDGKRIGFLALHEAKAQVFALPADGPGEAMRLTAAPKAVQQFAWSPDGARIAYVTEDEEKRGAGPERHNRSFEVGNNDFLVTTAPMPSHLWLTAADGSARARRLTSGSWTLPKSMPPSSPASPVNWSPDGKSIAFVKVATPYTGDGDQSTVQIIDVETGAVRALTGRAKNESQPVISPDGKWVSYWSPREGETRNVNEIHVAPFGGGEGRSVTRAIDRNVQRSIWRADGKGLLVSANDGTGVGLWWQPVEGGTAARRIELGKLVPATGFWLDGSMARDGSVALAGSMPTRPGEVYLARSGAAGAPERLTDFNGAIEALELGKTETVRWTGADGLSQDGVVTYPPGFDASRKYPLVLHIHGGPRSASKVAFGKAQLYASRGWVVFEPNYRGSDNLGNAFQAAIWNDAGAGPGRDVMSGVELLKKRGWVDETRMAPTGWSYGGYMTTWLLGNYPKAWRAAVAGAAVTAWMDQYNLGDANVRRAAAIGGSPWTDAKRMQAALEQSPIHYAGNIQAPTLILSNTGDYRVPVTQSYELYHALRDRGIPTQFIAYPLGGHSPADPVHARDVDRRWIAWLEKYLGGAEGAPAATSGGGN